jgi:trigger factor
MDFMTVTELGQQLELPAVKAPSLEGLSVTIPAPEGFTAEQVQQRFLELARVHATERYRYPTERIAWRDEVLLSIAGYSNGQLIPFSVRKDAWLPVEPEPLLPGLYEALVGRSPNEGLVVELTLPEEYPVPALRGAPARFLVHIQAVREVKYPDLECPAFLQAFSRGATLEEATRRVVQELQEEHVQVLVLQARQRVLDEVASRTQVRIPSELIDQELRQRWSASEGRAVRELEFTEQEQQESLRTWLQDEASRSEVEQRLRLGLALGAICQRDGLTLTPERVEKVLQEEATAAGLTLEEFAAALRAEPQHLARIDHMAWHLMAVEHVMSQAQVRFSTGRNAPL